jgi:hypothetical protein
MYQYDQQLMANLRSAHGTNVPPSHPWVKVGLMAGGDVCRPQHVGTCDTGRAHVWLVQSSKSLWPNITS